MLLSHKFSSSQFCRITCCHNKSTLSPGCEFELRKCIPPHYSMASTSSQAARDRTSAHFVHHTSSQNSSCSTAMWIFIFWKDQGSHGISAVSDQRLQVIFNHMCKHTLQRYILYPKPRCLCQANILRSGITWCGNEAPLIPTWSKVCINAISLPC